jgi:hypothetical protein
MIVKIVEFIAVDKSRTGFKGAVATKNAKLQHKFYGTRKSSTG